MLARGSAGSVAAPPPVVRFSAYELVGKRCYELLPSDPALWSLLPAAQGVLGDDECAAGSDGDGDAAAKVILN